MITGKRFHKSCLGPASIADHHTPEYLPRPVPIMALQAAVHGQGIVLANRILAQQEIENGHLQIVLPTELRDPKSFYVVNHLDRLDDEQIQAFRTWIKDSIKLGKI